MTDNVAKDIIERVFNERLDKRDINEINKLKYMV